MSPKQHAHGLGSQVDEIPVGTVILNQSLMLHVCCLHGEVYAVLIANLFNDVIVCHVFETAQLTFDSHFVSWMLGCDFQKRSTAFQSNVLHLDDTLENTLVCFFVANHHCKFLADEECFGITDGKVGVGETAIV